LKNLVVTTLTPRVLKGQTLKRSRYGLSFMKSLYRIKSHYQVEIKEILNCQERSPFFFFPTYLTILKAQFSIFETISRVEPTIAEPKIL